jgi:hypothetical protein
MAHGSTATRLPPGCGPTRGVARPRRRHHADERVGGAGAARAAAGHHLLDLAGLHRARPGARGPALSGAPRRPAAAGVRVMPLTSTQLALSLAGSWAGSSSARHRPSATGVEIMRLTGSWVALSLTGVCHTTQPDERGAGGTSLPTSECWQRPAAAAAGVPDLALRRRTGGRDHRQSGQLRAHPRRRGARLPAAPVLHDAVQPHRVVPAPPGAPRRRHGRRSGRRAVRGVQLLCDRPSSCRRYGAGCRCCREAGTYCC